MALAENQITLEVVEDGNAIYTEEPASPYESGDLYVKTEEVVNGLITDDEDVIISSDSDEFETAERGEANVYVCKNDRPSGVYNPDDWQLAATDNTQLNQLKEHFWYDDTGAHVQGETTGFRNDITSTGMKIVDTSTETSVAEFSGSGARIGKASGAHSVIDANGQRFYGGDGTTELANIGYGSTVGESGTTNSAYYTFGYRNQGPNGEMTVGSFSVAEGFFAQAEGYCSHAEGVGCEAIGKYSHAQNEHSIALSDSQTVLGKNNVEDANGTYAVIVGNGTAPNVSARSNALTVDWSGVIDTANGTVPVFPLFKKVSVTHNVTVAANSYSTVDFAPAAQTGYTRVGLVGWNTASTHVFIATCTGTNITFCNKTSSSQTCTNAQIDWLFIRSSI